MSPEDRESQLAAGLLDAEDGDLLRSIRAAYEVEDPLPAGLIDRLQFQITLDALHAEVATLTHLDLAGAGARSALTESVRTITFTSESLTTMVTITGQPGGHVRVDGWAAPGAGLTVEVLLAEGSRGTATDEDGRFVFEELPAGLARFVLHRKPAQGEPNAGADADDRAVAARPATLGPACRLTPIRLR